MDDIGREVFSSQKFLKITPGRTFLDAWEVGVDQGADGFGFAPPGHTLRVNPIPACVFRVAA